jgi:UDP-N-acetylglucosamine--N-acetylmuramyl-(pentapeptide) pyrophosphoryl-undecaprenol N-acetylglucosamine transferase
VAALEGVAASSVDTKLRILVVGGSQGARAVSDLVVGAAAILSSKNLDFSLVHQTGNTDFDRIQARYRELGLDGRVQVRAFIEDMAAAYGGADLVIGRAGALTLAELAIVGKPAIFIPLPTAADDHQTKNADHFAKAGAAVVFDQRKSTAEDLAAAIATLAKDRTKQVTMGKAMRELARPRAAETIVDRLQSLAARS